MKLLKILQSAFMSSLREEVSSFTELFLEDYINEVSTYIEKHHRDIGPKDIHDAVWGTIGLEKNEVLIIDSPIIQRLRKIQHLGLAGLLFPGAEYSRFEHTLGTLYVADRIASKVEKSLRVEHSLPLSPVSLVRLAAIFHDSGHTICSHASEYFFDGPFFSRKSEIEDIKIQFIKATGIKNIKLSELLSVLIVTSDAVVRLLEVCSLLIPDKKMITVDDYYEVSEYIASLILGLPVNDGLLPYSKVISGDIDADKCDYLARDSHRTGVPVAVDLYRLIQKIVPIEASPQDFGKIWDSSHGAQEKSLHILGISLSALRSVEEIIISRTLMHEKIYYHHKIRTAETMLRQALFLLDRCGTNLLSNFKLILLLSDNDIINNHAELFIKSLCGEYQADKIADEGDLKNACKILKDIWRRDLSKRATIINADYAFCYNPSFDIGSLLLNIFEGESKEDQEEFLSYIREELVAILGLIAPEKTDTPFYEDRILIASYPEMVSSDLDICIDMGGNYKWYCDLFQGHLWDNSRRLKIADHCIVSPKNMRYETFLAVEKVLFQNYGTILKNESFELCKLNEVEINKFKRSLYDKGYYHKTPVLVSLSPFLNPDQSNKINEMVSTWRSYEGPQGYSIKDSKVVEYYLKQYISFTDNADLFLGGMIRLLKNIRIENRRSLVQKIRKVLDDICEASNRKVNELNIFSVGNLQDSSAHLSYFINDLGEYYKENIKINNIEKLQNLIEDNEFPVVFIEDGFFSGTQIISIFQTLFGVPLDERLTNEVHVEELNDNCKVKLKERQCFLAYCLKNEEKEHFVIDNIAKLGLDISIRSAESFPLPLFSSKEIIPFEDEKQKEEVRKVLAEIGRQLLRYNKMENGKYKTGWDDYRINESCLGYGQGEQCIVFNWNTPTYTLTPLWMDGELENGSRWFPLFPRVQK